MAWLCGPLGMGCGPDARGHCTLPERKTACPFHLQQAPLGEGHRPSQDVGDRDTHLPLPIMSESRSPFTKKELCPVHLKT